MKKMFFLAAMMTMAVTANAQVTFAGDEQDQQTEFRGGMVDKRKNVVSVGVKVGGNFSTMTKYDDVDLGQKSGIGFEAGAVLAARFGKRTMGSDAGTGMFGVQIEPSYVQHTIGTDDSDIKLAFFEVPVLLKIFVTPNVNIEVGPNICGTLSSSPDNITVSNTRIATGDIKGFDVKACVGVSYETKQGLFGSLRYNYGFSELAKNFPCKVSALSVTVGYKFNVFKF